ncbi:MAG: hypothetical protein KAH38_02475 [Candidatus Hydrogenedentes bacterium]|nr:hypothetical protein [Candidatus Hydrogenedentota bacterium]
MNTKETAEMVSLEMKKITKAMSETGPVLFGTIKKNTNKRKRKDGSIYESPVHYTFVYKTESGKEQWKRVNTRHLPAIRRMKENGKAYRLLLRKYMATATCLALLQIGKKN